MEYTETKDTKLNPILKDKKIAFSLITLGGSIIVLTFATLEEFSQYYIPSRTFDIWDLLADFIGVVLFSFWRII